MSKIYKAFLANERVIKSIFARYFEGRDEIDDLTQETFVKCFAAELREDIREPKNFLLRAAKNLALSERKKKFRSTTDYLEDSGGSEVFMDEEQVSAEARLDGKRKLAALSRAVAALPEDYRRAFLMRKLDGLKLSQIATRMGVSVRTAQARVAKALAMCDAYLRQEGYEPAEIGSLRDSNKVAVERDDGAVVDMPSGGLTSGSKNDE